MPKYVALLRGIGPMNPNMRNEKLRSVFESLGFRNVKTLISSGNVIFESPSKNIKTLEAKVEKVLPEQLGFKSTTIIRSREQIENIIESNPFAKYNSPNVRLNVTFLKHLPRKEFKYPYRDKTTGNILVGIYENAIANVSDMTMVTGPDIMTWLEKQFGKEITTRTWNTVQKIMKKFGEF